MAQTLALRIQAANTALIGSSDLQAIPTFFTPDYVAHVTDDDMVLGHEGVRKVLEMYRRAFPDLKAEVEILVEAKDRVAWQRTLRATHRGDFRGFPATGKQIVWRDMVTSRFANGLIAEDWFITDLAERLLSVTKSR